ncbi:MULTISPECIES: hypothetical protein [unclassified Flammeovirga]|uniref:hypothetical protein n=1 Tax=unclassified Flammeovirga TaxID=2637820 RepID=UPI0012E0A885|nr:MULTISPECIES: hypothetical protein [unclassified Flammeovirga]MBD0401400.1 hypothetical protein [Flammeovirga sp. EKP202]
MRDTIMSSDHLSRFIQRIYEIKESRANVITQSDLKAAAKEIGVTDREWVKLQDLFSSHLARAIGYHKYKNWDDAIFELDQALTINPFDSKTLFMISSCYANKYYEEERREDRDLSISFANKCLEVNPLDEKALQLLSSLKKEERQRRVIEKESLKTLIVACSFGAIIFTALAYLSFSDIVVTTIPYTAETVEIRTTEFKPKVHFLNAEYNNSYFRVNDNIIKIFERKAALVLQGEIMKSDKAINGVFIKWKDIDGNIVHAEHFTNQYLQDIKDPANDNFKLIRFLESEKAISIANVDIVLN